jgi:glycosyltransferase involved in cell wall biosynthesis
MRIGIDARELCGRPTGVGRYLAGLLREWMANDRGPRHEFVLYAPGALDIPLDARRLATRSIEGPSGTWWEQVRLPRVAAADHLDVFFAPAYTAPLQMTAPTVAAIHDLSYVAHPEWFRIREGMRRRWLTRATAKRAATIITISDFSKREIVDRLSVAEEKVRVIPPGIDSPSVATGLASRSHPRLLYVGSILNRRHVVDLIRAVAAIAREVPDVSLDLVGDNRTFPHEDIDRAIANHGVGGRVRWHRYVTDDRLRDLYAGARAFVFLSEYEGLGLTPLEALTMGIPGVVADTPVARESLGDAAIYTACNDSPSIARALTAILLDESVRARVLAAAPAALAKYSWPRAARETLAVLEAAAL